MADNTIDWGQGANTNSISWGSGASNNTNGWGVIHEMSYGHPETDLVGDGVVPPVNPFDNASVVFSLRDIFGTGNAVARVRRDSDNTEQDFTATELTDGTLLAFVGAGSGFVSTWYDQKNTNNLTQSTSTQQPRIVNNGVLVLINNKATLEFDGVDDIFVTTQNIRSFYSVISRNTSADFMGTTNQRIIFNSTIFNWQEKQFNTSISSQNNTQYLISFNDTSVGQFFLNNTEYFDTGNYNQGTEILNRIGGNDNGSVFFRGYFQEFIVFDSDESSKVTDIQTNINNFYNIY